MLRIAVASVTAEEAVLRLEGWLSEEGVALLAAEVQRLLAGGRRLVLDLDGVSHIDPDGLDLLEGWTGARVALRGGSVYVRTLLHNHGLG
jgi:anti-anti-sigma regulatory factor